MKLSTVFVLLDAAKRTKSEKVQDAILNSIDAEVEDNITSDFASACADYVLSDGTLDEVRMQYERLSLS